jgi:hypothetical protein
VKVDSVWPDGTRGGAVFSEDERHRYFLYRVMPHAPLFSGPRPEFPLFVLLNPSTATHEINDATLRRCTGFAKRLGYSSLHVCNLFSLRSTDPKALLLDTDPSGDPENLNIIIASAREAQVIICGWGAFGSARTRSTVVLNALIDAGLGEKIHCLGTTNGGEPRHPLYLPASAEMRRYFPPIGIIADGA